MPVFAVRPAMVTHSPPSPFVTMTSTEAVPVPSSVVAVTVTLYMPASPKAWVLGFLSEVALSPKSHSHVVLGAERSVSSVAMLASKGTAWPTETVIVSGGVTILTSGALPHAAPPRYTDDT